jgi:hypothetical protein
VNATTRPKREVPLGGTPLRELAYAIAQALTLPDDVISQAEPAYLRISRDRARVVLSGMRRIIADRELDEDDLMTIIATIRDETGRLANGDASPADPFRVFVDAVIAALTISPTPPTTELAYLQSARQRSRRVLLACRRAVRGVCIEDVDLVAAAGMLVGPVDDGKDDKAGAGQASEMIP